MKRCILLNNSMFDDGSFECNMKPTYFDSIKDDDVIDIAEGADFHGVYIDDATGTAEVWINGTLRWTGSDMAAASSTFQQLTKDPWEDAR